MTRTDAQEQSKSAVMTLIEQAVCALNDKDPFFYTAKEVLRAEYPDAALIEIADNTLTIVGKDAETVVRVSATTQPDGEIHGEVSEITGVTH